MDPNRAALAYWSGKIYFNYVKTQIKENRPIEDILKGLKDVGLENKNTNVRKLEEYLVAHCGVEWDAQSKSWKQASQMNMLVQATETLDEIILDDPLKALSREDIDVLFKDMKSILSNSKRVVTDIEKIADDIKTIAIALRTRHDLLK